jgi:hypothetical protein
MLILETENNDRLNAFNDDGLFVSVGSLLVANNQKILWQLWFESGQ